MVYYWTRERALMMNKYLKHKKLGSADIASKIRREITTGNLKFREKLPAERILADFYGVSRGTVRVALKSLESEKFLNIKAGSGAFVAYEKSGIIISQVENANPLELIDARFAIEPHICRLAVLYGSKEHFAKLESLKKSMEQSIDDPKQFSAADTIFHKTLAESTSNNLLIWIINQITTVRGLSKWTKARNLTLNREIMRKYNEQHQRILEAIKSREPELAASSMKEHLETARLSITRASGI